MGDLPKDLDFEQFLSVQAKRSSGQKRFSYSEHKGPIEFLLEVYIDILKHKAKSIDIIADTLDATRIEIQTENGQKITKTKQLNFSFELIARTFTERSSCWPDINDSIWETTANAIQRLKFAPFSSNQFIGDFQAHLTNIKSYDAISISNINITNQVNLLADLEIEQVDQIMLKSGISQKTGIVITNQSPNSREVDGTSVILALRPDSMIVEDDYLGANLRDIIEAANRHLIIISSRQQDPVDMIVRTLGMTKSHKELESPLIESLRLALVHRRMKRNCVSCSKPAEVTPEIRDSYPLEIRSFLKSSYSYGSRCPECSFSGFSGSVGASSVVLVDNLLKKLLSTGCSGETLAQHVYQRGTRPLLLKGLNKIFAGLTVFSDLNEVAPKVSPYFLNAIAQIDSTSVNQEALLNSKLAPSKENKERRDITSKHKILIVEDDPAQRDILQLTLQTHQYDVSAVSQAEDALSVLAKQHVDLILCDYMLPGINGAQFAERIKTDKRYQHIPIVILTVLGDEETEYKILSGPADEFCSKDISRRVLVKRITRLIAKKEKKESQRNEDDNLLLKHLLPE